VNSKVPNAISAKESPSMTEPVLNSGENVAGMRATRAAA
jgi:hypothetical protein